MNVANQVTLKLPGVQYVPRETLSHCLSRIRQYNCEASSMIKNLCHYTITYKFEIDSFLCTIVKF